MISRLTAVAATFAVAVTAAATLTMTAQAQAPAAKVVELPHVVIVAQRLDTNAR